MVAQNYVIDLSDLTADGIVALICTNHIELTGKVERIDPTAELVGPSGKVEPIAADTKQGYKRSWVCK